MFVPNLCEEGLWRVAARRRSAAVTEARDSGCAPKNRSSCGIERVAETEGDDLSVRSDESQLALALEGMDVAAEPMPTTRSIGSRRIDAMMAFALKTRAASSIGDLLDQAAAVRERGFFNSILAVLQLPDASMLCSDTEWDRVWGRTVRPGERPLVLLFPFGPVEFVFDVSQTVETARAVPLPLDPEPFVMAGVSSARELVARLTTAVEGLGVRVITSRQGVSSAGHIRRTRSGGTIDIPVAEPGGAGQRVRERWVVSLNQSHPPTEQLATLAHELGHLFCGHVGRDDGDWWPHRSGLGKATDEFEAESVARLVFRRVAPGVELPEYLDQYVDTDAPPPDHGWRHVGRAADKVLKLIETPPVSTGGRGDLEMALPWSVDVDVLPGSETSGQVVVVRATDDEHGVPTHVGQLWSDAQHPGGRPWVLVVRSREALTGLMSIFDEQVDEDEDQRRAMLLINRVAPFGRSWTTVVEAGRADQEAQVECSSDPPNHGGAAVGSCLMTLREHGLACVEPELDESWMFEEHYGVQVLGWDDKYSVRHWQQLEGSDRLFIRLRPDRGIDDPGIVSRVAEAVSAGRQELDAYYDGCGEHEQ